MTLREVTAADLERYTCPSGYRLAPELGADNRPTGHLVCMRQVGVKVAPGGDPAPVVEPAPTPTSPNGKNVVLAMGHRSTNDGGNPGERERTDDLVRAVQRHLAAAGYTVWVVQDHDGDGDPNMTSGSLDTVSRLARDLAARTGAVALLDLHFEGGPSNRGVFSIIPDVTGLRTAYPGGAPADDTWENNVWDRQLGQLLADEISAATGLPKRGDGLMSERHTGVGYDGWRLATFAYTVAVRSTCVRLVVEHGNMSAPADVAIITGPGFYENVGRAYARAFARFFAKG